MPETEGPSKSVSQNTERSRFQDLSKLVEDMVDPLMEALKEIEKERAARRMATAIFIAMISVNVLVNIYTMKQQWHVVEAVSHVQQEQASTKLAAELTDAQINTLVRLAEENANTDTARVRLRELETLRMAQSKMYSPMPNPLASTGTAAAH